MVEDVKALGEVVVENSDGAQVLLGQFWRDRAAVLVFVRHFG